MTEASNGLWTGSGLSRPNPKNSDESDAWTKTCTWTAEGLSAAHTRCVIHRDLKPENAAANSFNSFISSPCCRAVRRCADQRAWAFAVASSYVPFQVASTSLGEFILVLNVPLPVRPLNFPLPPVN